MHEVFNDFINLIFPRYSIIDNQPLVKNEQFFTTQQVINLPRYDLNRDESQLMIRLYGLVPVTHVLAYLKFVKNGSVQRILHHIKYKNEKDLALLMGQWFGNAILQSRFAKDFDLLLPLPLHPSRLRKRGFNQSQLIVKGMAETSGIPWREDVLAREKQNISQTYKDRIARFANVENIFKLKNPAAIKEKNILVVDDIITTGATLEACIRELIDQGCASLNVAALAAAEK